MNKHDLREGSSIKVCTDTEHDLYEHFNVKGVFDGRAYTGSGERGMIVTVKSLPVRTFPIEDCIPCRKDDSCKPFHDKKAAENEADYILED